jgi:hypothetical protein
MRRQKRGYSIENITRKGGSQLTLVWAPEREQQVPPLRATRSGRDDNRRTKAKANSRSLRCALRAPVGMTTEEQRRALSREPTSAKTGQIWGPRVEVFPQCGPSLHLYRPLCDRFPSLTGFASVRAVVSFGGSLGCAPDGSCARWKLRCGAPLGMTSLFSRPGSGKCGDGAAGEMIDGISRKSGRPIR